MTILPYYVHALRQVTRRRGKLPIFLAAVVMHAIGHAFLALAAGAVAVLLAQAWGIRAVQATPLFGRAAPSDQAFLLSGIGMMAVLVKGAAGVYASYVQGQMAGEVGSDLRLRALDALLSVHRGRSPRHGDQGAAPSPRDAFVVSALTERIQELELGLKQGLLGGVRAVAQIVPLAGLLAWLSPRMAGLAALVLLAFGALLGRLRSGYQIASAHRGRERAELLEAVDESVRHADLWVSYGAEEKIRSSQSTLGAALTDGMARLEARSTAMSAMNEALAAAALVLSLWALRAGWLGGAPGHGPLLAFAIAFFLMYRPLRELSDARLALARADGALADLQPWLGWATERSPVFAEPPGRADGGWTLGALELRALRLSRGYGAALSLRIEPGSIVAILGPTGIGKSTLLRTLLGLEQAASGEVLFDGAALTQSSAGPTARPFAWVPQDAPVLADTLSANVSLGAVDVDVSAALQRLGAGHLVDAMGGSRLGAAGRAVSGGERQWIALARALVTGQPVLLLDEPTSGLDAAAERHVLDAIARLRGRRTVLLVTHRTEPLAVADVVMRLDPYGPTFFTPVTKYSVSAKHEEGTPLCCS